jgi:hypothetical protein
LNWREIKETLADKNDTSIFSPLFVSPFLNYFDDRNGMKGEMTMLKDCQPGSCFEGPVLITEWKEETFRHKQGLIFNLTCQDATLA